MEDTGAVRFVKCCGLYIVFVCCMQLLWDRVFKETNDRVKSMRAKAK
jgi:hypothetical protein|eukprot:COSAG06_NODE_13994_length_1199_cov_1.174545_1_plen_47_part_00